MPRIRTEAPRPCAEDISPFLSAQAADVHVQMICGRLAAEMNLLLDGYPDFHDTDPYTVYARAHSLPRTIRNDVRFAAGGIAAHTYFFRFLSGNGGRGIPDAASAAALRASFGSTDSFFYIFREEAQRMQTGGFLWLCTESSAHSRFLRLIPLRGYELPHPTLAPILALDLWEHAYLPSYGTDRRAYAYAFLRQLDWEAVGRAIRGPAGEKC